MPMPFGLRRRFAGLMWRLLSVPVYTKILTVVVVGALLFGAITLYEVWTSMHRIHREVTLERAESLAEALAARLPDAWATQPPDQVRREVQLIADVLPDCLYIRVEGESGAPLIEVSAAGATRGQARGTTSVAHALPGPLQGTVWVGIADESLTRELSSTIWPLLVTLGLCLLVSEILAVVLARLLVGPIRNLVDATNRIRAGDFQTRAPVASGDEIGQLAVAFNQMVDSLQAYSRQVEEKEAARQSLLSKIVQAQEEERKVLSRELHDQLGQSLSKVLLSLQSVHRECSCPNARCGAIEDDIRDAIDEVRRLAWAMRPSILDDFGLEAALGRYIQELSRCVEFPVDYQCFTPPDPPRLPSQVEVTLYRVTQEAMTNIMRHAQPTRASVVLLRRSGEVTLVVEDDGRGFDPAAFDAGNHGRRNGGNGSGNGNGHGNGSNGAGGTTYLGRGSHGHGSLGLLGMQERVALVGGRLTIESRPGRGAAVRVRIPLNEGATCPSAS